MSKSNVGFSLSVTMSPPKGHIAGIRGWSVTCTFVYTSTSLIPILIELRDVFALSTIFALPVHARSSSRLAPMPSDLSPTHVTFGTRIGSAPRSSFSK